ncbi:hypothetical protein SELMODRAFT_91146 [Selaginella moellendorffii]|uniref:DJ-1/PfpI domain-containing protein n=1 Tax=Selaginella moellendorffii TaxID=88036 RepID=D8RD61_SELML|nr:uncharacterized protein LOC9651269 [Selaginella moellendorffii]EFJ30257.1 hypothetical protein SELMODRAFT_91146 [Selaginella moellendorffii]|eukprot:XP_002969141.1 uncharacterized protein LOC9651269 [Selaginella moellendorffii]
MAEQQRSLRVAIPIFDHLTALDAVGPYEVLNAVPGVSVVFVSDKPGLILAGEAQDSHLGLRATASYKDVPHPDVIVVPGGPPTKIPLQHKPLLDWIRKAHETTLFTTSVCTGALILGSAGLLTGLECTTHWSSYKKLEEFGAKASAKRYIQQGKIITAAGVSSGIDMALYLAALLKDKVIAEGVQLLVEYDPQPPFDCGSRAKASPEVLALPFIRPLLD